MTANELTPDEKRIIAFIRKQRERHRIFMIVARVQSNAPMQIYDAVPVREKARNG